MSSTGLKKTVYIVRHGQSDDNAAPVFQAYDSPLSAKGRGQAERVASRIEHLDFEVLISSPPERAKQTAEAIALKTDKKVEVCDLFVERFKPTSINGKSYDNTQAQNTWRDWGKKLANFWVQS
jgi:broad specificity phosphatase PhoE